VRKLSVRTSFAAAAHFVTADGSDVALNTPVTLNGKDNGIVGYDGVAWLTGLAPDNIIQLGDGETACTVRLAFDPVIARPGQTLGPLVCVTPPPAPER
jgi:outer membrane usher protein